MLAVNGNPHPRDPFKTILGHTWGRHCASNRVRAPVRGQRSGRERKDQGTEAGGKAERGPRLGARRSHPECLSRSRETEKPGAAPGLCPH